MKTTPKYEILKNKTGERYIKLQSGNIIPADIAGLGAGKDDWMRNIECKCRDCHQAFPLHSLIGNGQWCEDCATADIQD